MFDLSQAKWHKATKSNGANTGCVEVAANLPEVAAVRDSRSPDLGAHVVPRTVFSAFLGDVKAGRYDL